MKTIWTIAKNTFRESIRDKILNIIWVFGIILMLASLMLHDLSMEQSLKMIKDIGLSAITLVGIMITIFVGSNMLFKETEKRTIYTVLSKPIVKSHYLLGKLLGLSLVIGLIFVILTVMYSAILFWHGFMIKPVMLLAILYTYLDIVLLNSLVLFFSTFLSPILTTFCSATIYFMGHNLDALKWLGIKSENFYVQITTDFFYYLLPNFSYLNLKNIAVYDFALTPDFIVKTLLYWLIYFSIIMSASTIIFSKKEF